ncbi:hypothetical protein E2C01_060298 [Portunus trituberculatus]|uniref:Uncharacterized protein n=1 Tax=Portunus trituberculatus TaxID=210409 RepID=A0A5B7H7N0_PORTR|nr:hypothetical protein [Portunus trituberculatus]
MPPNYRPAQFTLIFFFMPSY